MALPGRILESTAIKEDRLIALFIFLVATHIVQQPQERITATGKLPSEQLLAALESLNILARQWSIARLKRANDAAICVSSIVVLINLGLEIDHLKVELATIQVWLISKYSVNSDNKRVLF